MPICPICKKETQKQLEIFVSEVNNQEYKLYHCNNCSLQFWEPLKIVPEAYEGELVNLYFIFHENLREEISMWHKLFFKYFPFRKGKLLDVGCGNGVFLREAKKLGFECWGIDFDRKSIEVAKRNLNINTLYSMSLEEFYFFAKEKNLKFDIITFFEVLEHQDKPKEFLIMIRDMLKEGGYIAGAVPRRQSKLMNFYRKPYNSGDLPPHHFLRFDEKSLIFLFQSLGFESTLKPIYLSSMAGLPELIFGSFFSKLKNLIKKKLKPNMPKEYPVVLMKDKSATTLALKTMRILKNFLFFPIELCFYLYQYLDPLHIYFQAKKIS